jgi:hypothetical protein
MTNQLPFNIEYVEGDAIFDKDTQFFALNAATTIAHRSDGKAIMEIPAQLTLIQMLENWIEEGYTVTIKLEPVGTSELDGGEPTNGA